MTNTNQIPNSNIGKEVVSPVLSVKDLTVSFRTNDGPVSAVNNMNFEIYPGDTVGVVGESGSGKSQTFLAIMGLLAQNGEATGSAILNIEGKDHELVGMDLNRLNKLRGSKMSMIFQDPMTSLNPYLKISTQMCEVLRLHQGMGKAAAQQKALKFLDLVRIPEAKARLNQYPHELSGGMRQRVMIAMSLLCEPALLIADEPTTALDVTVQAQVLRLLHDLKTDFNTAIVLITHDLGVVAGVCDRVQVMYGGRLAEIARVDDIFYNPQHPYTRGLLESTPRLNADGSSKHADLPTIKGQPPNLQNLPAGCAFAPRCDHATEHCQKEIPTLRYFNENHAKACFAEGFSQSTLLHGAD
jgi:oligopeptide transport system ATP-binding protein